jgi:hypothetical protein
MCGHFQAEWEDIEKLALFIEGWDVKKHAGIQIGDVLFARSLFHYVGSDNLAYVLHRSSLCERQDHRDVVYSIYRRRPR